jgi:long-chain acyl-CoA synthetase
MLSTFSSNTQALPVPERPAEILGGRRWSLGFYDQVEQRGANTAIVTEACEHISYVALTAAADGLGKHVARRRVGFLLCENRFESVAGYLAFLRRRAVPVLINSGLDKALFADLLAAYRPAYVYLPAERVSAIPAHRQLATCGGYCLLETTLAQDYEVHPELGLLLTTSEIGRASCRERVYVQV